MPALAAAADADASCAEKARALTPGASLSSSGDTGPDAAAALAPALIPALLLPLALAAALAPAGGAVTVTAGGRGGFGDIAACAS